MQIRISKESDVPVREQIAEQIIFRIATEELKPAQALPSVRELARRLRIHHNTVSRAYADLARRGWLTRKRGTRVLVRPQDEFTRVSRAQDLDAMINAVIRVAREGGHSLQELRDRVRRRLLAHPPDHLLVIENDAGLRQLLQAEIGKALPWPLRGCSQEELRLNPGLAVGALAVVAQPHLPEVAPFLPESRPAVPVTYSVADEHLAMIRQLRHPSIIALVSVSEVFLKTAVGLLAPCCEGRHTLCDFRWPLRKPTDVRAADLVFCDSVAFEKLKHPKRVLHRLVTSSSIEYIVTAMEAYQKR